MSIAKTSNTNDLSERNYANTFSQKPLSPEHRNQLEESGIPDEVIVERGYYTETVKAELGRLGFARSQWQTPALVIPIKDLDGKICQYQIRPSRPRNKNGTIVKYEIPANSHLVIDVPTRARDGALDVTTPLFITEGVKKADAAVARDLCCISILGVHGWKNQDEFWARLPLEGRPVYVVFDSDVQTNKHVQQAAAGLCAFLAERKCEVFFVALPAEKNNKVGLDDYLAAGHDVDDLLKLATKELPQHESSSTTGRGSQFEATSEGLFEIKGTGRRATRIRLTNFPARITEEVFYEHEGNITTEFVVEATVAGTIRSGTVVAGDFDRMAWVVNLFGGEAVVLPGYGVRDAARAAIQVTSSPIPRRRGVQKTGWITDNGENVFVHAGGVIRGKNSCGTDSQQQNGSDATSDGVVTSGTGGPQAPISGKDEPNVDLHVRVPDSLSRYLLPDSREGQELLDDIQESLQLLFLSELRITIPCFAAIFRAILDEVDFALHLFGDTGNGKSELAALLSQFFGPGLDARHIPASWGSTALFLVSLTAAAKNVILVIDDLVHTGSQHDIQQVNRNAETVFRALGNRAGRGRAARDGSPREAAPPECLVVSTGEARPSGKSLNARVLNIEINPGDILGDSDHRKSEQLAAAQENARNGVYARVTTAYIEWLAAQLDTRRAQLHKQANEYRTIFGKSCKHARLANTGGELLAALLIFLEFAEEKGCPFDYGIEGVMQGAIGAMTEVLKDQEEAQIEEDPVERFLGAIVTALTTGKAHVVSRYGLKIQDEVEFPKVWGYEERVVRTQVESSATTASESDEDTDQDSQTDDDSDEPQVVEFQEHTYFVPKGDCIGWISDENIYLDPRAALAVAQRLITDIKQPPIPLSHKTLGKRLAERGLLVSTTKGRNTQRITIEGAKRDLFHIMAFNLFDYYDSENVDDVYGEKVTESSQESLRQKQAWQADRLQRNQEARRKRGTMISWKCWREFS